MRGLLIGRAAHAGIERVQIAFLYQPVRTFLNSLQGMAIGNRETMSRQRDPRLRELGGKQSQRANEQRDSFGTLMRQPLAHFL